MQSKCSFDSSVLFQNPDKNLSLVAQNCDLPINVNDDKLASVFAYYNWATLQEKDMRLLDDNEPKSDIFEERYQYKTYTKDDFNGS